MRFERVVPEVDARSASPSTNPIGYTDSVRFKDVVTMTGDTLARLTADGEESPVMFSVETDNGDGTYQVAVAAEGTPLERGYVDARGWHSDPALAHQEPPNIDQDTVQCAVCSGETRHRKHHYVALGAILGGRHGWGWVGSTCIPTGTPSFAHRAAAANPLKEIQDKARADLRSPKFPTLRVVAEAMADIRREGRWRKSSEFNSTRDVVTARLSNPAAEDVEHYYLPAAIILQWLQNETFTEPFPRGMQILGAQEEVAFTSVGMLCYLPSMYTRAVVEFVEDWVANVGEKVECDVTIREIKTTRIGPLVIFQENRGRRRLTWFPRNAQLDPRWVAGSELHLQGTVSRRSEWRAEKSTQLTRVKLSPRRADGSAAG